MLSATSLSPWTFFWRTSQKWNKTLRILVTQTWSIYLKTFKSTFKISNSKRKQIFVVYVIWMEREREIYQSLSVWSSIYVGHCVKKWFMTLWFIVLQPDMSIYVFLWPPCVWYPAVLPVGVCVCVYDPPIWLCDKESIYGPPILLGATRNGNILL